MIPTCICELPLFPNERAKQGCREDVCPRCGWNAEEHKRRLDKLQDGKGLVKCQDGLKRLEIPDRHILLG